MSEPTYPAFSKKRKHPYSQRQPNEQPNKQSRVKKPRIKTVIYIYAVILLCGITSVLLLASPKRTESKKTLDDTLVPNYDIFSTETPTWTPTHTPTSSLTPEPTIDFQATQILFDATKTQVAVQTQNGKDQEIHFAEVQRLQAQKDEAENQSKVYAGTLTFAAPMATDQAKAEGTQNALNYAATTTPQALDNLERENRIEQVDNFTSFIRWIIQGIILSFAVILIIFVFKRFIVKQDKQLKREEQIEDYQAEEEAKATAFKLAEQKDQLLTFVEISIEKNGSEDRKLATARDLKEYGIGENNRTALINLLHINNRIFEKKGKGGGFFLKRGNLGDLFEEIASGQFPPPGSFGRS